MLKRDAMGFRSQNRPQLCHYLASELLAMGFPQAWWEVRGSNLVREPWHPKTSFTEYLEA